MMKHDDSASQQLHMLVKTLITLHQKMGFIHSGVGNVFGWYDNFDLIVRIPNGRRETHAMATEFQMQPSWNCGGQHSLWN